MAMYANDLKPRVGQLDLVANNLSNGNDSVPVADAVATVDASGKEWAVALVNRDPELPLSYLLKFGNQPLDGTFDSIVLKGDSPEAFNDIEHPNRVVPEKTKLEIKQGVAMLPAHSLTIFKITVPSS